MTRINTNIESLKGLRAVQSANSLLGTSLNRLSSGLKINSGRDNPSGLIAAETLRSQITAIEQSIKNSNRANNVIATADGALGEIGSLLNQIRGLVQEGLNEGALSQEERQANQLQIDAALSAINRIASNTTFAGDKLLDGSKAFTRIISTADAAKLADVQINEAIFGANNTLEIDATVVSAAARGTLYYTGGNLSAATTIEVSGSKGSQVLFFGSSSTTSDILTAVNAASDVTGVEAVLTDDATPVAGSLTVNPSGTAATAGVKSIASTGDDNDLLFTAVTPGLFDGTDAVNIDFVLGTDNNSLAVAVSGNTVTVTLNVSTDDTSVSITKAYEVVQAVNANTDAAALVVASIDTSDTNAINGQGIVNESVVALAAVELDNGTNNLNSDNGIIITNNTAGELTGTDVVGIEFSLGAAGTDATVTVTGSTIHVTLGASAFDTTQSATTAATVVAAINANTDAAALVTASLDTSDSTYSSGAGIFHYTAAATAINGRDSTDVLTFRSKNFGSSEFVDVNVLSGSFLTYDAYDGTGSVRTRDAGRDIAVNINGQAAIGRGLNASVVSQNLNATLFFKESSNVANETVGVTITGGGSLFQIGQEVSAAGQVGIGIDSINTARLGGITGKLYELGSGAGKSLLDVGPDVQGSVLVDIINEAINKVSTLRGRLGAVQKNVIETNITTLGVALENISEARSGIVDTDFADETAKLTRAQILNQASISVLAIANQNPSQVLALLR